MTNMIAAERLYLTADKARLVREGDKDGATLYAAPGDEIPASAVERFKLVDGTIAEKSKAGGGDKGGKGGATKEKQPGQDKEKKPGGDKGGSGDGASALDLAAGSSDDLTRIKFVGTKVAAGFVAAGLTTFAQIAAIDAATPPAVEGTNATTKWVEIVESAKALAVPADSAGDKSGADAGDADQGGA